MKNSARENKDLPIITDRVSTSIPIYGCCPPDQPCDYCLTTRVKGWQEVYEKVKEANELLKKAEAEINRFKKALKKIATFDHASDCDCRCVPIYECGCYEYSQWHIVQQALDNNGITK